MKYLPEIKKALLVESILHEEVFVSIDYEDGYGIQFNSKHSTAFNVQNIINALAKHKISVTVRENKELNMQYTKKYWLIFTVNT